MTDDFGQSNKSIQIPDDLNLRIRNISTFEEKMKSKHENFAKKNENSIKLTDFLMYACPLIENLLDEN